VVVVELVVVEEVGAWSCPPVGTSCSSELEHPAVRSTSTTTVDSPTAAALRNLLTVHLQRVERRR
jgi:hypothetical protein